MLTLLSFASVLAGPPAVAQPTPDGSTGIGIRLLEAPVALEDDPRALSYIVDNLPPGTLIDRRFEVTNDTGAEASVRMYVGAADITPDSGFTFADGAAPNELTSWMTVTPSEVVVPSGGSTEGLVSVSVPPDATEAERYAVVWAEVSGAPGSGGISTVSRVGIRTYLSVGAGNGPPEDFAVTTVTAGRSTTGAPEVTIGVDNTGGRALDPSASVTLSGGPGGISAAPATGSGGSIAPGTSGTVTVALDAALPAGPWTADVTVTSGRVSRDGSGQVTFPDSGTADAQQLSASSSGTPAWIWIVVAAVVIALAVALALVLRSRARTST
ncbi:hypothetical protein HQ325_06400 [Rhodococcus sp. BP-349]|uniref:hypothetical protein n=1 Tax=unclassified Rhodococcus (in: high G+C Gram-positive bacteria) TaxID=192944 RepID=UPI001C9B5538|nr:MULTISPECIES: hypothetical protein [unclassified Rhodococcus (in: high G+C Gram-positive bacteria)]MBY6538296.1 hypothetical protein [Rhodococcus sp. BP-363]MBY6542633.1 hypothetical protein [Rhodococcus sp. BP-369]MBY6561863.1 hypothetical protein [Rhodococcus sp. BP-370]MBY6576155.1 hypothetical protein [Rhodococcus sp. BP-364]MBY6585456.1 hypothetical protein [Rhodococcus sp. BP-358]